MSPPSNSLDEAPLDRGERGKITTNQRPRLGFGISQHRIHFRMDQARTNDVSHHQKADRDPHFL
jgi:hypothetical protein